MTYVMGYNLSPLRGFKTLLEITAAFRVTAIAIKLDGVARSFAGGATVFLPIGNRTATGSILAGLTLFLVSHYLSLHFFLMYVTVNIFKVNPKAHRASFPRLVGRFEIRAVLN
jgi:hypothetical protein